MVHVSNNSSPPPPLITTEWGSLYPYTADLLCLDLCRGSGQSLPPCLSQISTPLNITAWFQALRHYLINGLTHGFRIGFRRPAPLCSASRNMLSAQQHPEVVQEYLAKECHLNRMLGPFSPAEIGGMPPLHINRFGVIPKGHNTGKWRLITDLSHPPSQSVNDGVDPALCSLTYSSVDQVAAVVAHFPPGASLAKINRIGLPPCPCSPGGPSPPGRGMAGCILH